MKKALYTILLTGLLLAACSPVSNPSKSEDEDYNHQRVPGASAEDLLRGETYDRLVVEVDYVEGLAPTLIARDNLENFLEARLNKPGGVSVRLSDPIPATNNNAITVQDIIDLENNYRDQYTSGTRLTAYFILLDGRYVEENVLGIAYLNTSMAIFEGLIRDNSDGIGEPSSSTVETAVMQHEFGHIMGLVDNGSPAVSDHVDSQHGAHCTTDSCLMYYQIRDAGFMSNLTGGEVPDLDDLCIADLQANGGK